MKSARSNKHPFPTCGLPTDTFYLPTIQQSVPLEFIHCRPSKSSVKTLGASGSTLGLAPSEHLRFVSLQSFRIGHSTTLTMGSQTGSTSILQQLLEKEIIQRPIFSLMLINDREGILSIGGTAAPAIEMVAGQTKHELDHLGMIERGEASPANDDDFQLLPTSSDVKGEAKTISKRARANKEVIPRQALWEDAWAWCKVQGAEGWWQILMQSAYVDGVKVLQNQAVVIDVGGLPLLESEASSVLIANPDQLSIHPGATPRSQSLLRLRLWLMAAATTI